MALQRLRGVINGAISLLSIPVAILVFFEFVVVIYFWLGHLASNGFTEASSFIILAVSILSLTSAALTTLYGVVFYLKRGRVRAEIHVFVLLGSVAVNQFLFFAISKFRFWDEGWLKEFFDGKSISFLAVSMVACLLILAIFMNSLKNSKTASM